LISTLPDRGVDNKVLKSVGNDFKLSKLSTDYNNFNNSEARLLGSLELVINEASFKSKLFKSGTCRGIFISLSSKHGSGSLLE